MSWFELYLWTRLDAVEAIAIIMALACILPGIFLWIYYLEEADSTEKPKLIKWIKRLGIGTVLSLGTLFFVPDKEEYALIYGLHWATNNQDVQQIPDDAARIMREWLNEYHPQGDTTKGASR